MRRFALIPPLMIPLSGIILISGCMNRQGYQPVGRGPGIGSPVGWGTGTGYMPMVPVNGPGGGTPLTGYIPPTSQPSIPIIPVSNPSTPTAPGFPTSPSNPSIPVTPLPPGNNGDPVANPSSPSDSTGYWTAWPLPPRNRGSAQQFNRLDGLTNSDQSASQGDHGRPMRSTVRGGSEAAELHHSTAGLPGQMPSFGERVNSLPSTPQEDLKYRGGQTIKDLQFVNLYVGGDDAWAKSDIESIDRAIAAAMSDRRLDNVMRQYFNNAEITSKQLPSHPLVGYRPNVMTQGDVEYCLSYLYDKGYLKPYDTTSTVFNFLLPPGTVLTDETNRSSTVASLDRSSGVLGGSTFVAATHHEEESDVVGSVIPKAEEGDSTTGLGGYHGSIRKGANKERPIYYSVDVYSERRSDGTANGIPVFKESWKNVVATLYHELQEARTDPDVEDAIRNPFDPNAERYLGWTSDRGEEVGDYPIDEARDLRTIVTEVDLADGSGKVPVQFQYSNYVHGPEGPIDQPHPLNR